MSLVKSHFLGQIDLSIDSLGSQKKKGASSNQDSGERGSVLLLTQKSSEDICICADYQKWLTLVPHYTELCGTNLQVA